MLRAIILVLAVSTLACLGTVEQAQESKDELDIWIMASPQGWDAAGNRLVFCVHPRGKADLQWPPSIPVKFFELRVGAGESEAAQPVLIAEHVVEGILLAQAPGPSAGSVLFSVLEDDASRVLCATRRGERTEVRELASFDDSWWIYMVWLLPRDKPGLNRAVAAMAQLSAKQGSAPPEELVSDVWLIEWGDTAKKRKLATLKGVRLPVWIHFLPERGEFVYPKALGDGKAQFCSAKVVDSRWEEVPLFEVEDGNPFPSAWTRDGSKVTVPPLTPPPHVLKTYSREGALLDKAEIDRAAWGFAWSPKGDALAYQVHHNDSSVFVLDTKTHKKTRWYTVEPDDPGGGPRVIGWLDDGQGLLVGTNTRLVLLTQSEGKVKAKTLYTLSNEGED